MPPINVIVTGTIIPTDTPFKAKDLNGITGRKTGTIALPTKIAANPERTIGNPWNMIGLKSIPSDFIPKNISISKEI